MTAEPTPQQRDAFCEWFAVAFGEQMTRLARARFPSDGRGAVTVRIGGDVRAWRHNNEAATGVDRGLLDPVAQGLDSVSAASRPSAR